MKTCHRPTTRTHQLSGLGVINCVLRVITLMEYPAALSGRLEGQVSKRIGTPRLMRLWPVLEV
jgi:hypothetical protein